MAMDQQKRIKGDLSNLITHCVRGDATESDMRTFAEVRNEVAVLINSRLPKPQDQAAVLGILLLQMFDGTPDDIAPAPS